MNPDEQGTPTPPDTPLYRQFLATQQAKQPSGPDTDLYRQFLAQQGPQIRHDPALRARQAARGKISDQEEADVTDTQPGVFGSLADAAQGIPGVGFLEAGARSLASYIPTVQMTGGLPMAFPSAPESYSEARNNIKAQTDKVPTSARIIGRTAAAVPLTSILPGSAIKSGAMLGAAAPALDADPSKGIGSRAGGAAVGAAGGALVGKALEVLPTIFQALRTPLAEDNIAAQQLAREKSGDVLYGKALAEGQGRTNTPAINQALQAPDNAAISGAQGDLRQHVASKSTDPERLDALYKAHSDRAQSLKRGLESAIPGRPNLGQSSLKDTKLAQQELLDAMSGDAANPGPMPTYRTAVQDQAERFGNIEATHAGQDYLRSAIRKTITSGRNLEQTTPRALSTEAEAASPKNRSFLQQGILGATKEDIFHHPFKSLTGRGAVHQAPDLLRRAGSQGQAIIDLLTKSALFGGNASNQ